jgi:hypothetical protein
MKQGGVKKFVVAKAKQAKKFVFGETGRVLEIMLEFFSWEDRFLIMHNIYVQGLRNEIFRKKYLSG